jgi:hypothetical protein
MEEDSEGKRRRNIIAASLVLLLALWSDASLSKLNVVGVDVALTGEARPLAWWVLPFYGYFLWRYLQVWDWPEVCSAYRNACNDRLKGFAEYALRTRWRAENGACPEFCVRGIT